MSQEKVIVKGTFVCNGKVIADNSFTSPDPLDLKHTIAHLTKLRDDHIAIIAAMAKEEAKNSNSSGKSKDDELPDEIPVKDDDDEDEDEEMADNSESPDKKKRRLENV